MKNLYQFNLNSSKKFDLERNCMGLELSSYSDQTMAFPEKENCKLISIMNIDLKNIQNV